MKNINKKSLIMGFVLGGILFSFITVYAISVKSSNVTFTPEDDEWEVTNVSDALNDLNNSLNNIGLNSFTEINAGLLWESSSAGNFSKQVTVNKDIKKGLIIIEGLFDVYVTFANRTWSCTGTGVGNIQLLNTSIAYSTNLRSRTFLIPIKNMPSGTVITFTGGNGNGTSRVLYRIVEVE